MGWIERLAYLPLSYILVITSILKIGLILCLCGTDYCSSGNEDESTPKRKESEPYGVTSDGGHLAFVGIVGDGGGGLAGGLQNCANNCVADGGVCAV